MKRNTAWYILSVTAGVLVILFLVRNRDPFGKNNTSFAVDQEREITRIELVSRENKVILEKRGEKWDVNGKSEARKSAIIFILKTLREIKIKSPVSADLFRSEVIDKKLEPVRVSVWQKRKLLKSFYVYKTPSNIYGNIMKLRVSSKPFIVYMPGYEDNIGSHFIVNELFWKPFTVCKLLPSQIGSVELTNFTDTGASFTIENNKGVFSLKGGQPGQDSARVKRYISYFVNVPFESWAFDLTSSEKGMIEASVPQYTILIKTTLGDELKLTIWNRILQPDETGKGRIDSDRVWGRLDDGNGIFVMRYFDLDPILKKRDWFLPDPK
jgi:hypothetical protein